MTGAADEAIERTAQEGAHSVYRYVARRAEPVADGVRWQTLDWHNRPHYSTAVFDGVAGIVLFLADYHRLTGDGPARELALGGLRWCSSPQRPVDPADDWHRHGLVRGEAGVGTAWLRLAAATGTDHLLAQAVAVGERLLRRAPGPVTDWQDGATGEGVFLLRLAQSTGDARFREGAVRRGEWLARVALRDERGLYWPWQVDDPQYATWFGLSFIPGSAGIGHFLLSLAQATGDGRWGALAWEAGQTLLRQAVPDRGGLNWPDTLDGLAAGEALRCQWCYGAAGVGLFFVKAHEVLGAAGAPGALATAVAAGETTERYGDARRNAVQCHGLAGSGELFLELYRLTGDRRWRERAHAFARLAFAYRRETPQGEVWQADDPGFDSPDFLFGASGTGHFFLRLWRPDEVTRPLL